MAPIPAASSKQIQSCVGWRLDNAPTAPLPPHPLLLSRGDKEAVSSAVLVQRKATPPAVEMVLSAVGLSYAGRMHAHSFCPSGSDFIQASLHIYWA